MGVFNGNRLSLLEFPGSSFVYAFLVASATVRFDLECAIFRCEGFSRVFRVF